LESLIHSNIGSETTPPRPHLEYPPCRTARSVAKHRFLFETQNAWQAQSFVGLTNDAFGYILTKVDFNSFPRYEYVSRTSMGEMTGEILIERSLTLIEAQ